MNPCPSSKKLRDDCFEYWKIAVHGGFHLPCHCVDCKGAVFNPANTAWDAAHRIMRAHGGSDEPPNVRPMIRGHHRKETSEVDIPMFAKGRRQAKRVFGVTRSEGFGWNRRFKKKISGEVVER